MNKLNLDDKVIFLKETHFKTDHFKLHFLLYFKEICAYKFMLGIE